MVEMSHSLQTLIETFMRHSMRRFVMFSKERGLSMSQMGTLMMLHRKGSCTVSDISEHLNISTAASSQLLNRLVVENLIERQENPEDRRVKQIVLTKHGNQTIKESMRAQKSWLQNLSDSLSEDEQEQVTASLNLLVEKTQSLEEIKQTENPKEKIHL